MTRLSRVPIRYRKQVVATGQSGTGQSSLESAFLLAWRAFAPCFPEPVAQYKPIQGRRYALDFAFVRERVGVELNGSGGGGYGHTVRCHACGAIVKAKNRDGSVGRVLLVPYPSHASGDQMTRDAEKRNLLIKNGWRVLTVTPVMLDDPQAVVQMVIDVLGLPDGSG